MAHSIELLLDDAADTAVRRLWDALTTAGLPSQARIRSGTNRPHITLVVGHHIATEVDDQLRSLSGRLPLDCVIGAPLVFGDGPFTLARLIVPTSELLDLHAEVHRRCLPHLTPGPMPHSAPGRWTPHTTLGRRIDATRLAEAVGVAFVGDLDARVTGLRRWDGDNRVDRILLS